MCYWDKMLFPGTSGTSSNIVTLSSMESEYVARTHSSKGIILSSLVVTKSYLSFQITHTVFPQNTVRNF